MGAALLGENIITEAKDILLEGIYKLDGCLNLYPVYLSFKINGLMNGSFS